MARKDDEAFARLVAIEGLTYQDAFIESRPGPRPERSNSIRVLAIGEFDGHDDLCRA